MKELVQSELAELFGWSNTKTHFMLKQAMVELTEALNAYGASDLLQDLDSDSTEPVVDVNEIIDSSSEEPTE